MVRKIVPFMILGVLWSGSAQADSGWNFQTSAELGFKSLTFETVTNNRVYRYTPDLITLNIGLTVAYSDFYLAGSFERTLEKGEVSDNSTSAGTFANSRFERREDTVTVGYQMFGRLSVFGGYLASRVTRHTSTFAIVINGDGPFAGLGYMQPIGSYGAISLSAAYASLTGSYDSVPSTFSEAEATGYSGSLIWNARVSDSLSYKLGFRVNRYEFETFVSGQTRNIQQNYNAVVLAIVHSF